MNLIDKIFKRGLTASPQPEAATQETIVANKAETILSDVGNFFKKVFESKITQEVETGALIFAQSPLAALVLSPAGAALMTSTVEAIQNAELTAIAAGQQNGTGAQKAALVASQIDAEYNAYAKENNLPVTPASLQLFISAFTAIANSFPAPAPNSSTESKVTTEAPVAV